MERPDKSRDNGSLQSIKRWSECLGSVSTKTTNNPTIVHPITATITSGEIITGKDNLDETKELNNRHHQGAKHRRNRNQWMIEGDTCHFVEIRHMQRIVEEIGVMSEMWESRTSSKELYRTKSRRTEIVIEEGEDRTEQQGFVEDS